MILFIFLFVLQFSSCCQAVKNATSPNTPALNNAHDFSSNYRSHCKSFPDKCDVIDITIASLSKQYLIQSLESVAFLKQEQKLLSSHHVFYVVITIKSMQQSNNNIGANTTNLHHQYEELDTFIAERSWWKVQQYPVVYKRQSRALPLLLEHLPSFLTEVGKNLAAIHFPPADECLKKKMFIRMGGGSWGNDIMINIGGFFFQNIDYIHGMFFQNRGKHEKQGYVEKTIAGCGDQFNLRTCVFLDITNCSYPEVFQRVCSGDADCGQDGIYDAQNRTYLGEQDPPDSEHLPRDEVFKPVSGWQFSPTVTMTGSHPFIISRNTSILLPKYNNMNLYYLYHYHWMFGVAYKPNYHLGVRIQEYLQDFYAAYHKPEKGESFTLHDSCVAVHLRRGDRRLPGVDMMQWCKNHTKVNSEGGKEPTGQWITGEPLRFGNFADMGCGSTTPFGVVSLQHVVNASLLLVNETQYSWRRRLNVMVMTDELSSLREEVLQFEQVGYGRSKVRIIVLPSKQDDVHKSRGTWQGTAEWWAGIEAIKQCSGFVAHSASAASGAIAMSMCYRHSEGYMKCPPVYYFS